MRELYNTKLHGYPDADIANIEFKDEVIQYVVNGIVTKELTHIVDAEGWRLFRFSKTNSPIFTPKITHILQHGTCRMKRVGVQGTKDTLASAIGVQVKHWPAYKLVCGTCNKKVPEGIKTQMMLDRI